MARKKKARIAPKKVSAEYINEFSRQLEALNKSAGKVIFTEEKRRLLTQRLLDGEAHAFDEVEELMQIMCRNYGRLSSALTCHFYDGIRQGANVPGEFKAQIYEQYDEYDIRKTARACAYEVAQKKNTVPLDQLLSGVASREIRVASERTVRRNIRRDPSKPMYCIVPNAGACAFCQMRASLGYQYDDKSAIESHNHCTCVATPVFLGQKVQGYDPKIYLDRYDKANNLRMAVKSGKEQYDEELKRRIQIAKDNHAEKTDEPWRATNETLIIMRYQQGLSS